MDGAAIEAIDFVASARKPAPSQLLFRENMYLEI